MRAEAVILIVIGAAVLLAAIFIIILWWIYSFAFKRARVQCDPFDSLDSEAMRPFAEANRKRIERLLSIPCEEVDITSPIGSVRLHGRIYRGDPTAPVEIMCHGYRSVPFRDFSGGALEAIDRGYNVILIDQRAHGGSGGKEITYGIRERYDLVAWAYYAADEFPGCDIILLGISMGGATVVAASELEMPESVRCIISDCPYARLKDILISTAGKMGFPKCVYPLIDLAARIFGGIVISEGDFTLSARNTRLPILIIHGEDDGFVPAYMSEELYLANPDMIRRVTFPGAHHGTSYLTDRDRYMGEVDAFVAEHLSARADNQS